MSDIYVGKRSWLNDAVTRSKRCERELAACADPVLQRDSIHFAPGGTEYSKIAR
jgi:hypothetical protein